MPQGRVRQTTRPSQRGVLGEGRVLEDLGPIILEFVVDLLLVGDELVAHLEDVDAGAVAWHKTCRPFEEVANLVGGSGGVGVGVDFLPFGIDLEDGSFSDGIEDRPDGIRRMSAFAVVLHVRDAPEEVVRLSFVKMWFPK